METVYVDFNNTIVESNRKILEILNERNDTLKTEEEFNSIGDKEKVEIFESDAFYNGLEFKPGVLDVLNKYNAIYDFVIVSGGTKKNLEKIEAWIRAHLGEGIKFLGLENFNKKKINMENAIQVDDMFNCLKTNAMVKILYKSYNDYPWQQPNTSNEYLAVNSWNEIDSILSFYHEYDCKTLKKR